MTSWTSLLGMTSIVGSHCLVFLMFAGQKPSVAGDNIDNAAQTRPLEADEVERKVPDKLKALLLNAQDLIEVTPRLDGVLVTDIQLSKADETRTRKVELQGRIAKASQRKLLAKVVLEAMMSESFWNTSDDEFTVITDAMDIKEPFPSMGSKFYDQALHDFFAGRYVEADRQFTYAFVEDSNRKCIHYWKAATAIALKQSDRAERRLESLIRKNPPGANRIGSINYAKDLQKLQGPLRQALSEMEEKVESKTRLEEPGNPK